MYRVVLCANFDELEQKYNEFIFINSEFNCEIINFASFPQGWSATTFSLSEIDQDHAANKIGEYKVIHCNVRAETGYYDFSRAKDFEGKLNGVNPAEGWVLDRFAANFPLAIFHRDATQTASAMGFEYGSKYLAFQRSGCETQAQFEEYQQLIANHEANLVETRQDAEEAFNLGRYGEYIRLAFLAIEQTIASLSAVLNHEAEPEKDAQITDMLEDLSNIYKIPLVRPVEYRRWRDMRNRVVHENEKPDPNDAEEAHQFFDMTLQRLDTLLHGMPYDLQEMVDEKRFDEYLKARVDLTAFKPLSGQEEDISALREDDTHDDENVYDDDDY